MQSPCLFGSLTLSQVVYHGGITKLMYASFVLENKMWLKASILSVTFKAELCAGWQVAALMGWTERDLKMIISIWNPHVYLSLSLHFWRCENRGTFWESVKVKFNRTIFIFSHFHTHLTLIGSIIFFFFFSLVLNVSWPLSRALYFNTEIKCHCTDLLIYWLIFLQAQRGS